MIGTLITVVVTFLVTSAFWLLFYRHNKNKWEKASGTVYDLAKKGKDKIGGMGR